MNKRQLQHDATASTRATLHQLWVAIDKCYEMHKAGQKILLEKQGDVSGEDQIEVKCYSDNLTDNHECFWKTLRNWLQPHFDPTQYTCLILLTTQQFGQTASIANWNNEPLERRLQLIQNIYNRNEVKYNEASNDNGSKSVPEPLNFQREVFCADNHEKLKEVIVRFFIEAKAPNTTMLHGRIKGQYLKGILEGKKDDFLNALFGYISQPANDASSNWEISFEDFEAKTQTLTQQYGHGTKMFPRVAIDISDAEYVNKHDQLFVRKIKDIEYHDVIRKAVEHYYVAMKTVREEFESYSVPPSRTEQYSQDTVEQFNIEYRKAARYRSDTIKDSQQLYDVVTGSNPQRLFGFDSTPRDFRNGLLHAELDDEDKGLKWRLE